MSGPACQTCGRTLVSDRVWRAYTKAQRDAIAETHARKQGDHCASCVRKSNEQARLGKPCKIVDCDEPVVARGYCQPHYRRARRQNGEESANPRGPIPVIHLDDVEWLAETGETFEQAATRLGVRADSLYKFLSRHDRLDLYHRLRARERDWEVVA